MNKRVINGGIASFAMMLLILDSKTALSGAEKGIELCIRSVIPSIFPFLVLSGVLTSAMSGMKLSVLGRVGRWMGIPQGAEGIFLTGLLGGYPAGAQSICQAWKSGHLPRESALRMLAFSSNAGPAFLFGMLGTRFFEGWIPWALWGIHIASAIAVAILLPGKEKADRPIVSAPLLSFSAALKQAVQTMGYVCGWVILFRVILAFLDRWFLWLLPTSARVAVYGCLELANGCLALDLLESAGLRFVLASGILAFGGICVAMQTSSVTGELGMGMYLPGKLLQTLLSLTFSMVLQSFLFDSRNRAVISPLIYLVPLILSLGLGIYLHKRKNNSSIQALFGV